MRLGQWPTRKGARDHFSGTGDFLPDGLYDPEFAFALGLGTGFVDAGLDARGLGDARANEEKSLTSALQTTPGLGRNRGHSKGSWVNFLHQLDDAPASPRGAEIAPRVWSSRLARDQSGERPPGSVRRKRRGGVVSTLPVRGAGKIRVAVARVCHHAKPFPPRGGAPGAKLERRHERVAGDVGGRVQPLPPITCIGDENK